eukprot:4283202-Prymnesium_polylepis.1
MASGSAACKCHPLACTGRVDSRDRTVRAACARRPAGSFLPTLHALSCTRRRRRRQLKSWRALARRAARR